MREAAPVVPNEPAPPPPPPLIPRAQVSGTWQGDAVSGEARIRLHQRGLVLSWNDARPDLRLPFTQLDGVKLSQRELALFGRGGTLTLTAGSTLDSLALEISHRACTMPELARGARTIGSRRGGPAADQAAFFAQLLEGRSRAEEQITPEGRVAALDGSAIARYVDIAIERLARERWPDNLPEQRALGAELEECCEPLAAACRELDAAAHAWRAAPDEVRLAAWRVWLVATERVFAAADRAWGNVVAVLHGTAPIA
ncbi:MAG: hypothetical protein ACT4R6_10470 [Gemmatimonadaceae bacterium]